MARWTIGSYSHFISEAMSEFELSRSEARELYTAMREWKEEPVFAADLENHPIVAAREANAIIEEREAEEEAPEVPEDIEDYEDFFDFYEDYPDDEIEGAFDSPGGEE